MLLCSPFAKWIFEWMRNNVRVIVVYLCAQIILQKHNFSLQLFIGIICTRISHTIIMHAQCIQLWERCTLCTATPFLFSLVFGLFAHSCALAIHYVHFSMKKFYAMSMADKNYVDMYRACCISRSLARSLFLNGWRSLNRVLCFAFKFTTNLLHDSIFMVSKFSFCRLFFPVLCARSLALRSTHCQRITLLDEDFSTKNRSAIRAQIKNLMKKIGMIPCAVFPF